MSEANGRMGHLYTQQGEGGTVSEANGRMGLLYTQQGEGSTVSEANGRMGPRLTAAYLFAAESADVEESRDTP